MYIYVKFLLNYFFQHILFLMEISLKKTEFIEIDS